MADVAGLIRRAVARIRAAGVGPVMWCVVLLSAGLTVLEMIEYPAQLVATMVLTVAHILCLLVLPFCPLPMSVAVAVTYVACALLPDTSGASLFYGMWVALAAIGRYGRSRWWWLMPPLITAVRWMIVARAGVPFGEYHVVVRRDSNGLTVDQVNDTATRSLLPGKPHSGKGLALHRTQFAALNDSINTSAENGTWILHATLPSLPE